MPRPLSDREREIVDLIDGYDHEIAALNVAKQAVYDNYRSELEAAGLSRGAIRAEVFRVKARIADRRRQQVLTAAKVATRRLPGINGHPLACAPRACVTSVNGARRH